METSEILLQADKDNYRAIRVALQGVSGVPVSVAEKDREFPPVGVKSDVVRQSGETESGTTAATSSSSRQAESAVGTVIVTSSPNGGDVYVDGAFVGNCPATLKLASGKHTVGVRAAGYKDWSREIDVWSGSEVHLTATLEKAL